MLPRSYQPNTVNSGLGLHGNEFAVIERFGATYRDAVTRTQCAANGYVVATGLAYFYRDLFSRGAGVDAHYERTVFPQHHGVARYGQCDVGR